MPADPILNGSYFADLWKYVEVGPATHTITQETSVIPTLAESGHLSQNSVKIVNATIDAAIASTDFSGIEYAIEGYDYLATAQKPFTISFWHRHTVTGTQTGSVRNDDSGKSYPFEYTQAATNTWEKAIIHVAESPSAGNWDYTTGTGLRLILAITVGSNFTGTVNTWNSAEDYGSTGTLANNNSSNSNLMYFAQVKIEKGTVANPQFIGEPIKETLTKIHRYVWHVSESGATNNYIGIVGGFISTTAFRSSIAFVVEMRAAPTMIDSGDADFSVQSNAAVAVSADLAIQNVNTKTAKIDATTATAVDGDFGIMYIEASTSGFMTFDARL